MQTIRQTLDDITIGPPARYRDLAMFPLLGNAARQADYLTFDEVLAAGQRQVTEVSESGAVREFLIETLTDHEVLLGGDERAGLGWSDRDLRKVSGSLRVRLPA
jgi:hypothetical protein